MTQHYIGLNRGIEGMKPSDFTTGTSTGSTDIELRWDDSKSLTREEIYRALKAIQRFLASNLYMAQTTGGEPPPDL